MARKSDGSRKILDFAFFNALYPRVNPGFVRFLMLFTSEKTGRCIRKFYGEGKDKNSFPGVTPKVTKRLTEDCEKLMLKWLKKYKVIALTDLKLYKPQESSSISIDMADNGLELGEDYSSDEEI